MLNTISNHVPFRPLVVSRGELGACIISVRFHAVVSIISGNQVCARGGDGDTLSDILDYLGEVLHVIMADTAGKRQIPDPYA